MEKEKNILDSTAYKKNPFLVPENYFSDFSENLESKIILIDSEKKIPLFTKLKPWIYIAASLLLFVGGIQWYISGMVNMERESAKNIEVAEPQTAEAAILYAYLDDMAILDYLASDNE